MIKILVNIYNGLLSEAITTALRESGEFIPIEGEPRIDPVQQYVSCSADMVLMEVAYAGGTALAKRLQQVRALRKSAADTKIVFLCDENTSPEIAHAVMLAKKDGLIDGFFYSSVSVRYILSALLSM